MAIEDSQGTRPVVIAGCGFIGYRLAEQLTAAGRQVIGLVQTDPVPAVENRPFPLLPCDITDPEAVAELATLPALADAFQIDLVHSASSGRGGPESYRRVYLEGLRNLQDNLPLNGGHLVFCSSTSVYAQADGSVVTEESTAEPERETGRTLRKAEDLALSTGGAVARLAGLYGPGRWHVLKKLLEGRAAVEGGAPGRYLNQLHREDAASGLAHLLTEGLAGIHNVADSSPVRQADCLSWLADRCGLPMPPDAPADLDRKRGWTDKQVSNAKLLATAWSPTYPSYRDAFEHDLTLVPSIRALLAE